MSETFEYDVFISHSTKDKPAARDLASRLKADGLRVWFDEWEIKPGDNIPSKIEEGLERSHFLIICISANTFGSDWAQLESQTFRFRNPLNKQRRFIPLRLDATEPQLTLKQFAYVDWRHKSPDQYAALVATCRLPTAIAERVAEQQGEPQPSRIFTGHSDAVFDVAVTPDGRLAVSGSDDRTVRVWELPSVARKNVAVAEATRYTNAKVLLVGDSGVGKSGLAVRLTEDKFEATVSTDAAWATQLKLPGEVSTREIEREIWLWDFAGQADYRLIHQLFMDETALAMLVFNPQSENPFEGLGQWDRDLQRAARRKFRKLLVAGRCDRGGFDG